MELSRHHDPSFARLLHLVRDLVEAAGLTLPPTTTTTECMQPPAGGAPAVAPSSSAAAVASVGAAGSGGDGWGDGGGGGGLGAQQGAVAVVHELAWEKLHLGHWKDVAVVGGGPGGGAAVLGKGWGRVGGGMWRFQCSG